MARDRRKKRARRIETKRGCFMCYRARDIWDDPVTYCGKEYTEVHIVAYAHEYHLTLRGHDTRSLGIISSWTPMSFSGQFLSLHPSTVKARVEGLLQAARAGELQGLTDHTWIGCLY